MVCGKLVTSILGSRLSKRLVHSTLDLGPSTVTMPPYKESSQVPVAGASSNTSKIRASKRGGTLYSSLDPYGTYIQY